MMPPQDHPEDLLDVMSEGDPLSNTRNRQLRWHIADCLTCATQVRMLERARRERQTPTAAAYNLDRIAVAVVLQRIQRPTLGLRPFHLGMWLPIVAGALLLSGTALAATWWSKRNDAPVPPPVETPPVGVVAARSLGAPARPQATALIGEEVGYLDLPSPAESKRSDGRHRGDRASAAELFARAHQWRLAGDPTNALPIYQRLQERYPHSAESHLSHVIVGRLWLARNKPELAVQQFSLYLRKGGSAGAEALVGRATAFAHLGRTGEEAADWRTLSVLYPKSVYSVQARARLATLEHKTGAPVRDRH